MIDWRFTNIKNVILHLQSWAKNMVYTLNHWVNDMVYAAFSLVYTAIIIFHEYNFFFNTEAV